VRNQQLNFTRGELSPLLHSRIDLDHYKAGVEYLQNWTILRHGGVTRTPGTILRGFAKEDARTVRFLPFVFNRAQAYAIEAGHLYFRFWNRDTAGRVESPPGTPVEVVTTYDEADLKYLQIRQSGDLIFIFCEGYAPRVLTRVSETSWSLALYAPLDGPYLDLNVTATTLDPSATSGSVTIVASAVTGINGDTGFQTTDVGRVIRFLEAGGRWYWFVITARASTTSVTATYMGRDDYDTAAMPGHAASANWRLGAWCGYEGYPHAVGLYEERLVSAATDLQPTTVWATVAQDSALDDYSIQATLAADDAVTARLLGSLATIQWIADGKDIILGTEGAIRILGRNDEGAGFGPLNMRQKPEAAYSTSYVPGFFIGRMLLFFDEYRAHFFEAAYTNEAQGLVAREIGALNEHLFGLGVTSIAYQASPNKVMWMTTDDGALLGVTYDRDEEVFGVARNEVGGDGVVEWVMSLPGIDADGDQVWLAVRRTVGGVVTRTIETLAAFWRYGYSVQADPIYFFCAGSYDGVAAATVTGLSDFEGDTLGIMADGVDLGDATVESGVLTLPNNIEASVIYYGYRQASRGRTLRLNVEGVGVGEPSLAADATIDVMETPFLRIGMGSLDETDYDNGLDPIRPDDISEQDPYAEPPLRTGAFPIKVDDSWSNNGVCTFETDRAYSATVRSITVNVEGAD